MLGGVRGCQPPTHLFVESGPTRSWQFVVKSIPEKVVAEREVVPDFGDQPRPARLLEGGEEFERGVAGNGRQIGRRKARAKNRRRAEDLQSKLRKKAHPSQESQTQ